jgi:lipopolysaccharide export system protein LptA
VNFFRLVFVCFSLLLTIPSSAQKTTRIELEHADVSEFSQEETGGADRLSGNVVFKHENTTMYCDTAYLYRQENRLDAYGNVRIVKGNFSANSRQMKYSGDTKLAQLSNNVVLHDGDMTLNTSRLDHNTAEDISYYTDSAHIVDGENVITSRYGYYYNKSADMFFKKDVIVTNPKFKMTCDTLQYNTSSRTAFFHGPTYIFSEENNVYCERGWYNTVNKKSLFTQNAYLKSKEQRLKGDTVMYDKNRGVGIGYGNVEVYDSINKAVISGNYSEYYEEQDSSYVTGNATLIQIYETDSMFIHGDTLKAYVDPVDSNKVNSKDRKRIIFCYNNVKIFKPDLQGKCDSLVYTMRDSTIHLYTLPVLWSGLNQLSSDSLSIQMADSKIYRAYLVNAAFVVSRADTLENGQTDSLRFNQIRGKTMTGYFEDNKLYKLDVNGNGQTIYYTKNNKQKVTGVNRADCSDLVIGVKENKVQRITLLNDPAGTLYPVKDTKPQDMRLKGFNWQDAKRPKSKQDIYTR